MNEHQQVVKDNFMGKWLIPTDNLHFMNDEIAEEYAKKITASLEIAPIFIATEKNEITINGKSYHIGDIVSVAEAARVTVPVYLVDGHHRYCASIMTGIDVNAEIIEYTHRVDHLDVSPLYDGLDAYEYFEKRRK